MHSRLMARGSILVVAVFCGAAFLSAANARPDASRVIDRTFVCATGYLGGIYQLEVDAYFAARQGSQKREVFANVATNLPDGFLGGVDAKEVFVNPRHCNAVERVRPTTGHLHTVAVDPLGVQVECDTPRTVVVRIRGEFAKPTSLRTAQAFGRPRLRASGAVEEAAITIATRAGRTIASVTVASTQKARLSTSTNCRED
jgi:hypothetical protein